MQDQDRYSLMNKIPKRHIKVVHVASIRVKKPLEPACLLDKFFFWGGVEGG